MTKIDSDFKILIRETLTESQFWEWVVSWKDGDALCHEAEGWDEDTKKEEIARIKKRFKVF